MFGVDFDRPVLAARIAERFASMRERGWSKKCAASARVRCLAPREAIGYREVLGHLSGAIPVLDDAFDAAVRRTRRFARRQRVWFGRDPRVRRLRGDAPADELVAEMMGAWTDAVPLSAAAS